MLLTIEDLENLNLQALEQVVREHGHAMNSGDLQSIALFQIAFMDLAKKLVEEKKRVIVEGIINDPEFHQPTPVQKKNKRDNIFVILAFLFATLFASCGNDNATATTIATTTDTSAVIDTQAICGNYCNPYIKQILALKQERDSLETLLNAFVEQTMRLELKGTTEFYSKPKTTTSKKQTTTSVPKQKYTYVGQVYRGKKGGLFQVYIDDTGKRQKHYISSDTKKQQILDSKNYIDVSSETIDNFLLSERIPIK